MKVNQKTAVYQAILMVLESAGVAFQDGMNIQETMTKDLRAQVNAILFDGFRAGDIELDREYSDQDLRAYVSGLQSNWLRKDKRLNGNTTYQPKNPGSRAGSGDQALVNAKRLLEHLKVQGDSAANIAEVEAYIAARSAEIAKSKVKTVDFSALPASLRAKFQK
jgi:hypothetical protein